MVEERVWAHVSRIFPFHVLYPSIARLCELALRQLRVHVTTLSARTRVSYKVQNEADHASNLLDGPVTLLHHLLSRCLFTPRPLPQFAPSFSSIINIARTETQTAFVQHFPFDPFLTECVMGQWLVTASNGLELLTWLRALIFCPHLQGKAEVCFYMGSRE